MCGGRKLNEHAGLVSQMARTLGIDLMQAMVDGRLTAEDWRDAVMACTGCAEPGDCHRWLAERQETGAAAPPAYCRNGDLMGRLAQGAAVAPVTAD
ncbi:DUF6455 family protein [Frigidibacter oleivorans]|uniref:DUF6455 family protein n=1 Tax=Frigidibacter oleivorans TaxID=2487129 RepID=UPI000F8D8309|nr:DUF6455 family protein [Frigidibacter oleivorans]